MIMIRMEVARRSDVGSPAYTEAMVRQADVPPQQALRKKKAYAAVLKNDS